MVRSEGVEIFPINMVGTQKYGAIDFCAFLFETGYNQSV